MATLQDVPALALEKVERPEDAPVEKTKKKGAKKLVKQLSIGVAKLSARLHSARNSGIDSEALSEASPLPAKPDTEAADDGDMIAAVHDVPATGIEEDSAPLTEDEALQLLREQAAVVQPEAPEPEAEPVAGRGLLRTMLRLTLVAGVVGAAVLLAPKTTAGTRGKTLASIKRS